MIPRRAAVFFKSFVSALIIVVTSTVCLASDDDPYIWLEEVENEKALEWAKTRSDDDTSVLESVPEYAEIHAELLEIYNSQSRIPWPGIRGDWIYNFWRDDEHVRGIWRRTTLSENVKEQPAWEPSSTLMRWQRLTTRTGSGKARIA